MRPILLQGEKVMLGVPERNDMPEVARHFQNPALTVFLQGYGRTFSLEEEYAWYDSLTKNPNNVTFAILNLQGKLVGNCSLMEINRQWGLGTFGIAIFDPKNWNKGYGTEATRLMIEYGMYHQNLYNIDLTVYSYNLRGYHAYLKAGFREVGRRRGALLLGGQRHDKIWMEITRDQVDLSHMKAMVPLLQSGPL